MSGFTTEQRAELRAAIDVSRREALATSRRMIAERKSPVVRAAEHAERAQQARPLMAAIIAPRPASVRCGFCGKPADGGVCTDHDDLADGAS